MVVPPQLADQQRRVRASLLARVPEGTRARALDELYLAEGMAEASERSDAMRAFQRRERMLGLARALLSEVGPDGIKALRAHATERFMQLSPPGTRQCKGAANQAAPSDTRAVQGRFVELMCRYGALDSRGRNLAPSLTIRAMYAARWNLMLGFEADYLFSQAEVCAYSGWIALHATDVEGSRRLMAAERYAAAECPYGHQAVAQWRFLQGQMNAGLEAMRALYEAGGSLRVRNQALHMLAIKRGAGLTR